MPLADPALQQVQGSERSRTARGGKLQMKKDLNCKGFMLSIRQRHTEASYNSIFAISGEK
jgi:hypothetical protein